jgi:NADH-quinone oxidoreductase subunit G
MATIFVDGRSYDADPARNLLEVCLSHGLDLPYFCWHPSMGSIGACRQCAVKQFRDEKDTTGRLVMACMTPVADRARISIADAEAVAFRAGVIEGLMESHPHDCPVCDEGGECHLQDMTVMTGHTLRRYPHTKRTFRNQYLGPFIAHEMNRCIQCYRCVRFYRDYAGGRDLQAFGIRNLVYFGRAEDGVLENEFSGNLVDLCPTGVFTDRTLAERYTRKWDLQTAPSICVHCSLGCNITAEERYGQLRRIVNRYHRDVNGHFICDRGRFAWGYVNDERRIREPRIGRGDAAAPASPGEALEHARTFLAGRRVVGLGSPRASLEGNFALRALVGADRFHQGVPDATSRLMALMLAVLRGGPVRTPSLREIEESDAVLVLGEDFAASGVRAALSLRQAVRQQPLEAARQAKIPLWQDAAVRELLQDARGPLFVLTPVATSVDDIATVAHRATPQDLARIAFAVGHLIDGRVAEAEGLPAPLGQMAGTIAEALAGARRPLVVSGTAAGSAALIEAAASVASALLVQGRPASLALIAPEVNSVGLAMMDARPFGEAARLVAERAVDTVVILENDLFWRFPAAEARSFLESGVEVVALDHLANETTARASLVLPAATFAEGDGTFVSSEGRAQRAFQVFVPAGHVQESWRWLRDIGRAAGHEMPWETLDDVLAALKTEMPALAGAANAAPSARFRIAGQRIPREPHRYSGRTAIVANLSVHEPKPPDDPDSPLAYSMEGALVEPPAATVPRFWSPGWNSIQALNKYQEEINGPLRGGPAGVRLIEPAAGGAVFVAAVPDRFEPPAPPADGSGAFYIVTRGQVFGSDEISRYAAPIAERIPPPFVAVAPDDAARAGWEAGSGVEVEVAGQRFVLPIALQADLPHGVAALPAGVGDLKGLHLPAWGRIGRRSER